MGISVFKIKRWAKMLSGHSIYHVEQNLGKHINTNEINGYYNDLTQKVIQGERNIDPTGIPFLDHSDGSHVHMPTMIFQYGLGAYDLFLETGDDAYLKKAITCADWALNNQLENGAWNNFFYIYPNNPYSAMSQGEGASLLIRIYKETGNDTYLMSAIKAIRFMLTDISEGGVAIHKNNELILLEYTHLPVVLNGWIFAIYGLYDICKIYGDYKAQLNDSISTLKKYLPLFDNGYWSMYDVKGKIASPFYHNLHIAQMQSLYLLTGDEVFRKYEIIFKSYQEKRHNKYRAFIKKAMQKIKER